MGVGIDLIRAKQQQINAEIEAAAAAKRAAHAARVRAFAETGIPAMWDEIKDIMVPFLPIALSAASVYPPPESKNVPLAEYAISVSATRLMIRSLAAPNCSISWRTFSTVEGRVVYCSDSCGRTVEYDTPVELRDDFVEYMANVLPALKNTDKKTT